jgi:BASS family bile acid:Na+ symporter
METVVMVALRASVFLLVFGLALRARMVDVTYVVARPGLLIRSLVSIYVVVPVFTAAMVAILHLDPAVEIALVSLSVAPIPPLLPRQVVKTTGDGSYAIGLLLVMAVLALVLVPLSVKLLGYVVGKDAKLSYPDLLTLLLITVLAPLAAGLLVGRFARGFADRIAGPVSRLAPILLILSILPLLIKAGPALLSLMGNGTLAAIVTFIVVGIVSGLLLGGKDSYQRTVLAMASSSRHPGIALTIAGANYEHPKLAAVAILLYLLVNIIVAIPYRIWRKHDFADAPAAPDAAQASARTAPGV